MGVVPGINKNEVRLYFSKYLFNLVNQFFIEGQLGVAIPSPENVLGPNYLGRCGLLLLSLFTSASLFTPGENHEMYTVASVSIFY
jgi:hypothetical protein